MDGQSELMATEFGGFAHKFHHENTKGRQHETRKARANDSSGFFRVFLHLLAVFFVFSSFRVFAMEFMGKAEADLRGGGGADPRTKRGCCKKLLQMRATLCRNRPAFRCNRVQPPRSALQPLFLPHRPGWLPGT